MMLRKNKDFEMLLIVIFPFFAAIIFMGSSTQTPEEFDKEFIEKFDACVERAKQVDEDSKQHVPTMRRLM